MLFLQLFVHYFYILFLLFCPTWQQNSKPALNGLCGVSFKYLIIFFVCLGFKKKKKDPISLTEARDIVKWMDTDCPLKQYLHSFRIFPRIFLFIFIFVEEKKTVKPFNIATILTFSFLLYLYFRESIQHFISRRNENHTWAPTMLSKT